MITGVTLHHIYQTVDSRGEFREVFRRSWLPPTFHHDIQVNQSISKKNVLRGLHYHLKQHDYWWVVDGALQVGLYDLRIGSPTEGQAETHTLTTRIKRNTRGLLIPPGVLHGYLALENTTMCYVVDRYYDNTDEYNVRWNHPAIGIPWQTNTPILSPRDAYTPPHLDPGEIPRIPAEAR